MAATDENTMPYKVTGHRHKPEIAQELAKLGWRTATLSFVPHLLPFDQGELASCYVRASREVGEDELRTLYTDRYEGERFVEVVDTPPGVRDVRDTNLCRIYATVEPDGGRVMVFAAIDNLWKGAAGQAVQNLNLTWAAGGRGFDGETSRAWTSPLPLPLGAGRRPASRSSSRPSWRRASAPPGSTAG